MKPRIWASGAVVWAAAYLVVYLVVLQRDGNGVAWWYVGLVAVGAMAAIPAALRGPGPLQIRGLIGSLVLLAAGVLLGLLTIGVLLVPAVIGCAMATKADVPATQ